MENKDILAMCDHTLLKPEATWNDIKALCDDAIKYGCASVCIPPCYVGQAKKYVGDRMKICTVIGFPNGYSRPGAKMTETRIALVDGADEIDMVININKLKDGDYEYVLNEIRGIRVVCNSEYKGKKKAVLKVIIETCLLTEQEKIKMCEIVTEAGADYIKTSTGFSTGGATIEDVALMKAHIGPNVKIKAAGGISSFEDAENMIEAGAERLGTSRLVKIAKSNPLLMLRA